jgi:hypothetical protein
MTVPVQRRLVIVRYSEGSAFLVARCQILRRTSG